MSDFDGFVAESLDDLAWRPGTDMATRAEVTTPSCRPSISGYEESVWARESITPEEIEAYSAAMRSDFAALAPERFLAVVALAGPLTSDGAGEGRFEFGLDVLVRGLAAMAEADGGSD
jgi:hypothetical protein